MQVLSCRLNEEFCFPGSRTSVRVLAVQPGGVSLGIDTPVGESRCLPDFHSPENTNCSRRGKVVTGLFRRRASRQLQAASVGLGLARLQLRAGLTDSAQLALEKIHEEIQELRQRLEGKRKPAPRRARRAARGGCGKVAVLAGCSV
jgi:hypothetical protein